MTKNIATISFPLCQHWMENAARHCKSPAMRRKRYCYFHQRAQARSAKIIAERARQRWFESAPLQDAAAVQRALTLVLSRVLSDEIDNQQAGQILHKLETAILNRRRSDSAQGKADAEFDPNAVAEDCEDYKSAK
jgi:hypothetical protein